MNDIIVNVLIVLVVIMCLLVLYKKGKKEAVRNVVLALVVQSEKALGSGTGELKYAMVIDKLYDKLPLLVKLLFTQKELDLLIEEAVIKLKQVLSKGATLTGYDDEKYIDSLMVEENIKR